MSAGFCFGKGRVVFSMTSMAPVYCLVLTKPRPPELKAYMRNSDSFNSSRQRHIYLGSGVGQRLALPSLIYHTLHITNNYACSRNEEANPVVYILSYLSPHLKRVNHRLIDKHDLRVPLHHSWPLLSQRIHLLSDTVLSQFRRQRS